MGARGTCGREGVVKTMGFKHVISGSNIKETHDYKRRVIRTCILFSSCSGTKERVENKRNVVFPCKWK
jgi:hypothetical protein